MQYRPVVAPILVLLVILLLSFTLGRFLWGRVSQVRDDLGNERQKNEALTNKLQILESLDERRLEGQLQDALSAIPSKDATLFTLSSIRENASRRNLALNNLRLISRERSDKELKGAKMVELRLDVQGGLFPTLSLLQDLRASAPLTRASRVRFVVSGTSALANLTVLSFWGALPEKVGKVEDPIVQLTSAEEELLREFGNLSVQEGREVVPAPPQGRENPFAF